MTWCIPISGLISNIFHIMWHPFTNGKKYLENIADKIPFDNIIYIYGD